MKFKTIIVEDEEVSRLALIRMIDEIPWLYRVGEAENVSTAIKIIEQQKPDVLFLDIKIPGGLGIDILRNIEHVPNVIFTTAYSAFAVDAFDHRAVDYLLKPFSKRRFNEAIDKLRERLFEGLDTVKIFVNCGNKTSLLEMDQVDYFRADKDYVIAHNGVEEILLTTTLKALEEQLNPDQYIRIHRSYIVNFQMIRSMVKHGDRQLKVKLRNGVELSSSRAGAASLRSLINKL